MSELGIGAMLAALSGNENTTKVLRAALGKTIAELALTDDRLHFTMGDGSKFVLYDDAQSCCERRYMRTDDDLGYYVGATLQNLELRDGPPSAEGDYGEVADVQFLAITTDRGEFVCSNHNEHNGYYGGFAVVAAEA